jgi:hypothetical protein
MRFDDLIFRLFLPFVLTIYYSVVGIDDLHPRLTSGARAAVIPLLDGRAIVRMNPVRSRCERKSRYQMPPRGA